VFDESVARGLMKKTQVLGRLLALLQVVHSRPRKAALWGFI
jgi:hypothetical protein